MDKFRELFLMVIKELFHSMANMLQEPLPMDNMPIMLVNMPQEPITQLPSTQLILPSMLPVPSPKLPFSIATLLNTLQAPLPEAQSITR